MVNDVQAWIDGTAGHFGWILIGNESSIRSAKRFNSRNSSTLGPRLVITYTPPAQPPGITSHPQSTTINSGATANLSVSANGTGLTYQWYRGNSGNTSNPINGATSSSFTTPALTQTTSYWVRVTNAGGSVDSNTATVSVTAPSNRQRWMDEHFTPTQQGMTSVVGDDVVNSSDGLSNLLKYAFDLDPFEAHPEAHPAPGLQTFTIGNEDCEFLTIQFTRIPAADDLTYEVRVGDDLSAWTTIYSSVHGADPATDPDLFTETGTDRITVTVRDTVKTDSAEGANRFIQLIVTRVE